MQEHGLRGPRQDAMWSHSKGVCRMPYVLANVRVGMLCYNTGQVRNALKLKQV